MIPDFLSEFEFDLKRYERTCIRITAKALAVSPLQDPLGLTESKFLGLPFFPADKDYPRDGNGKPMLLAAQLNFEQIPRLQPFPEDGMLQLFLSPTDWFDEDVAVVYHSKAEMDKPALSDFSFLSEDDYKEQPIFELHQLAFKKGIDRGGSEDVQFDCRFNGLDYWDFTEGLTEEQEDVLMDWFDPSGHKIGGYADFTQGDPREDEPGRKEDVQLLQIDTDDHIMFGDSGLGHVFINRADLINKDFSKAYFYWDCC